jgi:hypothetical protein
MQYAGERYLCMFSDAIVFLVRCSCDVLDVQEASVLDTVPDTGGAQWQ